MRTLDLMLTLLDPQGCDVPRGVTGASFVPLLDVGAGARARTSVAFGIFAGPVCATDGRSGCLPYPEDIESAALNLSTLMAAHLSAPFDLSELRTAALAAPFDFTKGVAVLEVRMEPRDSQDGNDGQSLEECRALLFHLDDDPGQTNPRDRAEVAAYLRAGIARHFAWHDAPAELFGHFGVEAPGGGSRRPEDRKKLTMGGNTSNS